MRYVIILLMLLFPSLVGSGPHVLIGVAPNVDYEIYVETATDTLIIWAYSDTLGILEFDVTLQGPGLVKVYFLDSSIDDDYWEPEEPDEEPEFIRGMVYVYNVKGQMVYSTYVNSKEETDNFNIDFDLAKGVYFIGVGRNRYKIVK